MRNTETEYVAILKALADSNRLLIFQMLAQGELCACYILTEFKITQPTLSHHMKILCNCGLVKPQKVGIWTFYSLNDDVVQKFVAFITDVATSAVDSGREVKNTCQIYEEKECCK